MPSATLRRRTARSARGLAAPFIAFMAVALTAAPSAEAHEVRPGYLELIQTAADSYDVLFKVPMLGGSRLRMTAVLPENCEQLAPVATYLLGDAALDRMTIRCDGTIVGQTIAIAGLNELLTDVLVRIQPLEGSSFAIRLKPSSTSFVVPEAPSAWDVARTYLVLGFEHILGGIDHLLFVLALLLIVRGRWLLLKTITAFTVAHSITLAAATLGFVSVPGAPVEAVISLSIVFLASELAHLRLGRPSLTQRYPWVVSFTFGLLHGFGFAGALAEVGLPQDQIPLALLQFNIGVELGQLTFVAAALGIAWAVRGLRVPIPQWAWRVPAYAIGGVAAFWTIERIVAFW